MLEEMNALYKNQTWELVLRPKGVTPVGYKWIFNLKYKANGTLEGIKLGWWPRAILSLMA